MGYMVAQKGGYDEVGFTKKDLHNHIDRGRQEMVKDGDAYAALIYLQCKADNDPLLLGKYTLTNDDRLQNLFWADGASIIDYACFGDVLAFDSTYKSNKYNKPLIIFSGSNHHGQTTIFGCALVSDEKVETYKWVLETLLEIMSNKHPSAVVTDGDGAMREAIKEVFPKASHRLCAWHLHRNACENVKNPLFLQDLKTSIYSNFTQEEFEEKWNEVSVKHGFSCNKWVMKTYDNKEMWATAYLREKFFGHIRITSQCEGINSLIKNYVKKKSSLVDFMHKFHEALREYRNNELISDFNCMFSTPVLTTSLPVYEKHAADVFTQEIFKEVKCEIEEACAVNVTEKDESGDLVVFQMNVFGRPQIQYQVTYDKGEDKFLCDCRLFESRGIPCSHILAAMKLDHFDSIPKSLICKRWTRDAKSDYISTLLTEVSDARKTEIIRFGALASLSNRLCNIASTNADDFMEIRDEIYKLIIKLEHKHDPQGKLPSMSQLVGDPTIVKTTGAPSKKKYGCKKRRCSNCNKHGDTIRRCPLMLTGDDLDMEIDKSCSDSAKSKSDDEKPNDFGCENDEKVFGFGPINDTQVHKQQTLRRSDPKEGARKKSTCPTQDSKKGDVTKKQKTNLVHMGPIASNGRIANNGSIVQLHVMNYAMGVFPPHYPEMLTYHPYPPYPMYGGVPFYLHNSPYYIDPKYGNSGHRPRKDDVSRMNG